MRYSWIPPKRSRGVPWAREVASITHGVPKTSRIPTGGWRSFGAVPSQGPVSPIPGTPYWSGLGQQGGTTTATATTPSTTAQVLGSLTTAAAAIYSTWSQQQIAQSAIRRGVAPPPPPPPPGAPAPAAATAALQAGGAPGGGIPTWALIAGGVGVAAVVGFGLMKKRR
jgi:hypothetical protein